MEFQAFTEALFARAKEKGLDQCEAYSVQADSFEAMVQEGELTQYNVAQSSSLTFRALLNGKMGVASTQTLDEEAIDFLVENAAQNAAIIESDDEQFFAPAGGEYKPMDGYSEEIAALTAAEKIELAKSLEKKAKALDQRIKPMETFVSSEISEIRLVNSLGLNLRYRDSGYGFGAFVTAREGENVAVGGKLLFGRKPANLDPDLAAKEAVKEALDGLSGKPVPTGDYAVLLRRDVAASLLGVFSSVFSAEDAQKGLSLLKGREGAEIASGKVTIVDDPHHPEGAASRPFDREGSPTYKKNVVENGKLTTLLHNLKTAKKQGVATTGNAAGTGGVAPSNFYIQPGEKSLEELAAAVGNGLLITDLEGMHSGANQISGDFSLGARGYVIENGRIGRGVRQITVAGNFFQLLKDVVEVGGDFELSPRGTGAPTVWVKSLSVAGA